MHDSRRHVLLGAAATALASPAPASTTLQELTVESLCAQPLEILAEALLAEYSENATVLGLGKGARAELNQALTDRSLVGVRTFDDAVVKAGAVPLTLLERVVDAYIARA